MCVGVSVDVFYSIHDRALGIIPVASLSGVKRRDGVPVLH